MSITIDNLAAAFGHRWEFRHSCGAGPFTIWDHDGMLPGLAWTDDEGRCCEFCPKCDEELEAKDMRSVPMARCLVDGCTWLSASRDASARHRWMTGHTTWSLPSEWMVQGLTLDAVLPPAPRTPWVGKSRDGYLRSAQVDAEELDQLAADDPRRRGVEASRRWWLALADQTAHTEQPSPRERREHKEAFDGRR